MRNYALLPTILATSAMISSLAAQEPQPQHIGPGTILQPGRASYNVWSNDAPRALIGVSTSSSATARDTLGVLVSSVRTGSPADKAGLEEGNRIASINGVSLKLAAADVGDEEMAGAMTRRLTRELDKLKPGDELDLRVYAAGQTKALEIKTVSSADLYQSRSTRMADERPTLGLNLAVTGNSRDTLGVFVMAVDDGGPAAKAGIEEGARIASINGVDVRGHRVDADDDVIMRASNVSRLEREVSRLKPGDDVELRVYYNGQSRNVKLKAGRVSDLPPRSRAVTIIGGDNLMMPSVGMRIDGEAIGSEIRRAIDSARMGVGRAFDRVGGRLNW